MLFDLFTFYLFLSFVYSHPFLPFCQRHLFKHVLYLLYCCRLFPQFWNCGVERPVASTRGRLSKKKTSSQLRISDRGRVTLHGLNVHLSSKFPLQLLWLYKIWLIIYYMYKKSHFLLTVTKEHSFNLHLSLTDKKICWIWNPANWIFQPITNMWL